MQELNFDETDYTPLFPEEPKTFNEDYSLTVADLFFTDDNIYFNESEDNYEN